PGSRRAGATGRRAGPGRDSTLRRRAGDVIWPTTTEHIEESPPKRIGNAESRRGTSACDRLYSFAGSRLFMRMSACSIQIKVLCLLIVSFVLTGNALPKSFPQQTAGTPGATANAQFDELVDQYFDDYFQFHPSDATATGFHQYDSKLEDYSRAGIDREIASVREYQRKFAAIGTPAIPAAAD